MANSALVVVGSDEPRPFMRGILVQSLVSRGVPFDVALETANEIRGRLANQEEVALHDLSKLVEELLADRYDLEALPLPPAQEPPQVSGPRGTSSPFSKGVLAVSLQGAGLDPNDAYDVARELEVRLLREARRSIDRVALRDLVSETIERTHGSKAAERYRVWRQALEDGRPIFLLLGGSTGVGKTSIAVEVARRLEISRVIGTDSIRQIMRLMFSADLMPEIHCSTYDAYRALHLEWPVEGGDVIVGFREQAQKIVVGVHALLDRAVEENVSMMVEGVNLLPGVLHLDRYRENAHVIFLVVATLDSKAYAARFQSRAATARERGADRYLRFMDEIRSIQDHVLAEAEQLGLPIIDNVRLDDAVLSVTRSVISTLKKSMSDAVDEGAS
ncbi:MAG: hypothetical protein O7B23_09480 [Deltaproteobacteria bacterium]|nr:hypothetical protein [Deltaproteobacteria bacterium]MCZ6713335.1 hypothetical protein [Deltaproteobacteria bacterium]MCZ6823876.1 hypothetical protein [Deltaproteobacteria bacterium]